MNIPFFLASLGEEEKNAVSRVIDSGWLTSGKECDEFEREFGQSLGTDRRCISVSSATSALHLLLYTLNIEPGSEIIVPSITFTATAEVVRYINCMPVFADIDPETLCISSESILRSITERTRAVIAVHFGGMVADLGSIGEVCKTHDLHLIEDCAHAYPSEHNGISIGGRAGSLCAFSFYANKTITTGEGGMIVIDNCEQAERIQYLKTHGISKSAAQRFRCNSSSKQMWAYDVLEAGFKYNLPDINAAIGRVQVTKAIQMQQKRSQIAEIYKDYISKRLAHSVKFQSMPGYCTSHAYHLFPVILESRFNRDSIVMKMSELGVGLSMHYRPLHKLLAWVGSSQDPAGLTASELYTESAFSLPIYPNMSSEQALQVMKALEDALND